MDRIDQLRAFVRVVERGSFTAVARELRVKQSTVSKWLQATEDELGVHLLDRTTRSQRLTDAGRRFYEHARGLLAAYDSAVSELRAGESVVRGRIRVSLPVVFGRLYVVPLLVKLLRAHPELELEMAFADRYVNLVEEGFDVAVRVGIPVDSSLVSHSLGESRRSLVASPSYLRKHPAPVTPADLAGHECLVHTDLATPMLWTFDRGGKKQRVVVRGRVSANNSEVALALAKSGLGICLLATWLVDADVRAGRLVRLLPDCEAPGAPVRALTPPGRQLSSPRVRALIAHLRKGLAPALDAAAHGAA